MDDALKRAIGGVGEGLHGDNSSDGSSASTRETADSRSVVPIGKPGDPFQAPASPDGFSISWNIVELGRRSLRVDGTTGSLESTRPEAVEKSAPANGI